MDIHLAGSRPTKRAPKEWFTGTVLQDPIIATEAPARLAATRVSFEPGARTAWHSHPLGQTLYVISGVGRVQTEGGPVRDRINAPRQSRDHGQLRVVRTSARGLVADARISSVIDSTEDGHPERQRVAMYVAILSGG